MSKRWQDILVDKNDKTLSDRLNMKPSEKCKKAGLKSLAELSEISGKPVRTLTDWSSTQPQFFALIIAGAVMVKTGKMLQEFE